jgi:hypothetical protein
MENQTNLNGRHNEYGPGNVRSDSSNQAHTHPSTKKVEDKRPIQILLEKPKITTLPFLQPHLWAVSLKTHGIRELNSPLAG